MAERKPARGRGLAVRAGSVHDARTRAGLTLEQVASGQVSRAAIHAIEAGRSRPTRATLQLIARTTGQPLSFFLAAGNDADEATRSSDVEADLLAARLEALLYTGHEPDALQRAEAALAGPVAGRKRARLMLVAVDARLRLSQAGAVAPLIAAAREIYEKAGDRYGVVECLDRDGYARLLRQDPSARLVFDQAIELCRQLDPCPWATLSTLLSHLGSWFVQAHDWAAAADAYAEAVKVADSISDLRRVGQMYGDLAAVHQQLGDVDEALRYAHKALAMHEARTDQHSIVRAENNLGMTLLRAGDNTGAEKHIRRALILSEATGYEVGRVHVLLSLAESQVAAGRTDAAEESAQAALAEAARLGEDMSTALAHRLLGEVAGLRRDAPGVRRHFEAALALLGEGTHRERLIETCEAYGRVLEGLGREKEALAFVRRALSLSRPQFSAAADQANETEAQLA